MKTSCKLAAALIPLVLVACGGGGGGGAGGTPAMPPVISGVASEGAPIVDGEISVVSLSNGQVFYPADKTAVDGKFSFQVNTTSYPPPYLIRVIGPNQEAPTYSYVATANSAGVVVTPLSTAAVALGANASPEAVFKRTASIGESQFQNGLGLVFAAGKDVFNALGANDSAKLVRNTAYQANGTGIDAALDVLTVSNPSASNGQSLVTTKLSGKSVLVSSGDSPAAVQSLAVNGGLAQAVINAVNANNNCIREAINGNDLSKWTNQCLDASFKDEGATDKAALLAALRADLPLPVVSIPAASVKWCDFDDPALGFSTSAASLANKTGICYATFRFIGTGGVSIASEGYYRFVLDGSGNGVSSVRLFGNQLDDRLAVRPAIIYKARVDGLAGNTGVRSGYEFIVGTASNTVLSAKVEILDHVQNPFKTFYMQCLQGAGCLDSELTVCADNTCSLVGTDNLVTGLISVNSTLASQIVTALQQGTVRARITAYDKILLDGTKATVYTRTVPITGVPIAQGDAEALAASAAFPELTAGGASALANWSGQNSLAISFTRGPVGLNSVEFSAIPTVGVANVEVALRKDETAATFNATQSTNGSVIAAIPANCIGPATYRALYFQGHFRGVPVTAKWFGSCGSGDY